MSTSYTLGIVKRYAVVVAFMVGIIGGTGLVFADTLLPVNLVSYWKFNEHSGDAVDSVGSNTLYNTTGVTYAHGVLRRAAYLVGTSSEYFSNSSPSGLNSNTDFSVNSWVYLDTLPSLNAEYDLVSIWNGNPSDRAWLIGLDNSSGSQMLDFATGDGSTAAGGLVSWSPATSTWYMITLVYTHATHQAQFYVNGVAQGSPITGLTDINTSIAASLGVGNRVSGNIFTYLDGRVDETGYWTRDLSQWNIRHLYNHGYGMSYPFSY